MPYTKKSLVFWTSFQKGLGKGGSERGKGREHRLRHLSLSHWIRWDSAKQALNHVFCSVIICLNLILFLPQVVRSRLQEQGHARNAVNRYAGALDCTKKVFRKDGIPGFYRGCATNLLRTTPAAVITFTSYEMIQRFLRRAFPPEQNHSGARPQPVCHTKSQQVSVRTGEKKKDGAQTQQNQLAKRELTAGS